MNRRRDPFALIPAQDAELLSPWAPVNVPQVLSGYPHNLPPRRDRPRWDPFTGMGTPGDAPSTGPGAFPGDWTYDPHHYAELIQGNLAVGLASVQLLSEPASRRNFLSIRNSSPGTEVIFVSFGSAASALSWLRLTANQIVLFDTVVPQNDIYVISDTATGAVAYAFSTIP